MNSELGMSNVEGRNIQNSEPQNRRMSNIECRRKDIKSEPKNRGKKRTEECRMSNRRMSKEEYKKRTEEP